MARPYSAEFLTGLYARVDDDNLGIRLAKTCVKANLPSALVAKALGVSRASVHAWFRGQHIQPRRYKLVEAFMRLVNKDMETGVLPAANLKMAKQYIETMLEP